MKGSWGPGVTVMPRSSAVAWAQAAMAAEGRWAMARISSSEKEGGASWVGVLAGWLLDLSLVVCGGFVGRVGKEERQGREGAAREGREARRVQAESARELGGKGTGC